MVTLFHDMMHKEIEVYVDDMIAKSKTDEDHTTTLQKLFDRLRKYQLKLNPSKCTFGATSGKLLGFIVSEEGIKVDPDKVRAIMEMPSPKTEKEIRGFLGRLNYISRFISHLTPTCEPIFKLLRKNNPGKWNEDCEEAFNKIKQYLQSPPVLIPPAPGRPLILYLTVLESSVDGVLGQHDLSGKKEHAIYYLSKKFTDYESRYSMLERTCCALVWTAHHLRQYMLYHTTCLISKMDPIKYIFEKPSLSGRIAKWQVLLSEYDIVYVTKKAIKGSAVADHLAAQPVADYEPMRIDFLDENIFLVEKNARDHETWTMLFDGASNELGHGIGVVLISSEGKVFSLTAKLCFECTHNIAEYEACIMGLQVAWDMSIKKLKVLGDSMLVIHQVKEEWEIRDAKLVPYSQYVTKLSQNFEKISFDHVPREDNRMADALATLAVMFDLNLEFELHPIQITKRDVPAYCMNVGNDNKPWYFDIKQYIKCREYPYEASENDKRTIRRLAMNFFLSGEVLYKRNHDMVLLRCVDEEEAKQIMTDIYEGICGTHANGHMMARQILRSGYYWTTMELDCIKYARECKECQIYMDKIHVAASPLHILSAP
ncbi:hypothetical protein IC582_028104 [Cucumis melo]